ncbi:MAG: DNA polymerase III subunit gamma/tau [Oscillochloridaceae bacterium]|nr:DNA polymerase III subunit gamma/tau [Chloroflexaceae bacterium]MDW8388527.1 DNA polymerase III subunit gamma/tau [Oscillochloridaceae bacterium]
MASLSLYRKWRSQTFAELVGQEHVVRTLRNAIVEERVAHAYLFTGPRGVGKTSVARLLAKAVNCLAAERAARPCGQCEMCLEIAEGRAVDVIEMDAASNTSVEDARTLISGVMTRPTRGRYRVYIIDEAHMLSTAAFNALLKTLEEPPEHAIFVLATTEVHKVPATILSRCQRFTFTRHGVASTAAHLRRVAASEGLELEPGAAEAIARAATGSLRDALGVLEQLASYTSGRISVAQVQSLLGMTSSAEVAALIEALLDGDAAAALRAVNAVADQGADLRQFTRDLVERLRSLLLLLAAGDHALADIGDDEREMMTAWARRAETGRLLHWVKLFSALDHQLRATPYGQLPLELAVVEALLEQPAQPLAPARRPEASGARVPPSQAAAPARRAPAPVQTEAPAPRLDSSPTTLPTAPAPPPEEAAPPMSFSSPPGGSEPALAAEAAPASSDDRISRPVPAAPVARSPEAAAAANADFSLLELVEAHWEEIKRDVRPRSPTVQALLHSVRPIDVEGNTVVLLAASPFHKENLEKAQNRRIVEEVIQRRLGVTVALRCTIEARAESRDLRSQIREARKDELVRAAMNIFEAHIVDIEPPE